MLRYKRMEKHGCTLAASALTHTGKILRSGAALITSGILLAFVLFNFIFNLIENVKVQYVTQMVDPIKVLTTSVYSNPSIFLMLLYPILVVFPTCTLWLSDKGSGMITFFVSRSGRRNYWFGKLGAVFAATFIIFTVPFLIELLLCVLSYDPSSLGDPSGNPYVYALENDRVFFMYGLWARNRYLYALLMIVLFGGLSGILACFNFSVTTLPFMRFRILTFFPVYVLLYAGVLIEGVFRTRTILSYFVLFRMFYSHEGMIRNDLLYFFLMMGLLLISVVIVFFKSREDQLS